jgi:hypothetical protein
MEPGELVDVTAKSKGKGFAGGERLRGHLLAQGVLRGVVGTQLDQVPARRHASAREMPGLWLVHLARVNLAVAELDGRIAVGVRRSHCGHDARACRHDGHRHHPPVVSEDLGHAELGAQDSLDLLGHFGASLRA